MLYKHLVVFIVFILLMFSIHYVKPEPPVREGFLDFIETELRKSKVGSAIADVGVDIKVFKRKSKPKPKPKVPTFRWWWSQPNANGWGKNMSGVDVVSKSYYDKQVKKKEEFYGKHRWVCLPGSDVPVRIHPYNKYILEQHPSSMRGSRDKKTKICKGYSPIVYDKNAQHGDPKKRPPNTRYKVNWSSLFRGIGDLNDDYGEEPVGNKGGGFYRLNEYYNNENRKDDTLNIEGKRWHYWYSYSNKEDENNRINATHVILKSGGTTIKLKIPDTVRKLNDDYGIYCANHIPENSFYYTEKGIGSSDEWPDDAMESDFNCETGPWPPKTRKTDIFKKSNYVNDRNGKPIQKNVKRYNEAGPRKGLVLECEENVRNRNPYNCRNPALWERRCKAVTNLCEKNLTFSLEEEKERRENSDSCIADQDGPQCDIQHPSCNLSGRSATLTCNELLNDSKHGYDKSNPETTRYWSPGVYGSLNRNEVGDQDSNGDIMSRVGGNVTGGRGRNYDRIAKDDYFNNKEIYGPLIEFGELPLDKGIFS